MTKSTLAHIIPSKTRRNILAYFFEKPTEAVHLRRVARELDEQINAVARELAILEKAKVLRKEKRENKVYFSVREDSVLHEDLLRIFLKEGSLASSLRQNLPKLGKVSYIVVSRNLATRTPIKDQEIYLLVVGTIVVPEVDAIITHEKGNFPFEINYTVMTDEEFTYRKKNNDPFIWNFLKNPKIMIVGDEGELVG